MKFIADENIDKPIIDQLRLDGRDVISIAESRRGATDDSVLCDADAEGAVLITMDKDFGEFVFRQKRVASGIILLRLHGLASSCWPHRVSAVIVQRDQELLSAFTVITPAGVRLRRLDLPEDPDE